MSRTNVSVIGALAGALGLLLTAGARAQQAGPAALPPAILPAAPAELLGCLPTAPPGWTMTGSNAASSYFQWLTTIANRDFKQDPPPVNPNAAVPTVPFVPGMLSVHLTDGGYYTIYDLDFVAPASGAVAKNTTFLRIGQYPARKYKPDEVTEILTVLVKRRFLLELRGKNMLEKDLVDYLSHVDYQRLLAIPDTGPHVIPQPVTITRIDELDPKQNRSFPMYWAKSAHPDGH